MKFRKLRNTAEENNKKLTAGQYLPVAAATGIRLTDDQLKDLVKKLHVDHAAEMEKNGIGRTQGVVVNHEAAARTKACSGCKKENGLATKVCSCLVAYPLSDNPEAVKRRARRAAR